MKKKVTAILMALCVSLASLTAMAADTDGYVTIKELKAWDNRYDVYLTDNQNHTCGNSNKTRFVVSNDEEGMQRLLISAFLSGKGVRMRYTCDSGTPWINAVRVR